MNEFVTLDYGSGGKKTSQLIEEMVLPLVSGHSRQKPTDRELPHPSALCDGAVLEIPGDPAGRLVFSTDSFVVSPCFFPGGDIGKLAVCGTVNDIAMMGAVPQYLSLSYIIEEGMPFAELRRITESVGRAARDAGVRIVTGDTKVVDRGRGDGIYINTAGIGFFTGEWRLTPERIQPGDAVIVSGNVGDHGTAVMLARHPELGIMTGEMPGETASGEDSAIHSDCAALHQEALALTERLGDDLRVMRDPTRGGLATTLNEFVEHRSDIGIELTETDIPVSPAVRTACDMLGLDPLYCACEGRLIAVTAPERAEEAVAILRELPHGRGAAVIGRVTAEPETNGRLIIRTPLGTGRIAQKLSGNQLPRIC